MEGVDKHADKKQHFVPRVYLKAWETQVETLKEPDKKFKGIYVIKDGKRARVPIEIQYYGSHIYIQ